ncbi:hypothetical protein PTSG_11561 [Salpingoeca rosetta]|uniref:Uncharacterized protein n=1 Tax=Salpingoeca rosetta (strain ATCC 50818 / BSB-021) TaxID=946362 RepID=F2TVV7_SALR5|nr:uncharacterized protein PTSG_11561 [Salpingoeca rosetta]EGD72203.1 hypothetical protein PTSG_11561 [Salpingoeca rosetta]|eukprot:XP_004998774.1 hypothetical protein PTSG_11561 [Salpingoeca rosetta]
MGAPAGQAAQKGISAVLNNSTMTGRRNMTFAVLAGWAVVIKLATGGKKKE